MDERIRTPSWKMGDQRTTFASICPAHLLHSFSGVFSHSLHPFGALGYQVCVVRYFTLIIHPPRTYLFWTIKKTHPHSPHGINPLFFFRLIDYVCAWKERMVFLDTAEREEVFFVGSSPRVYLNGKWKWKWVYGIMK
jgi:hypothetical protein